MNLSRPMKVLVGIFTVIPLAYMVFFFASFFTVDHEGKPGDSFMFRHFNLFFLVHGLMMLLMFALLAFYVVFLFKSQRIPNDQKALWAVVLFFGSFVAMAVFWWLYIWPDASTVELPPHSA